MHFIKFGVLKGLVVLEKKNNDRDFQEETFSFSPCRKLHFVVRLTVRARPLWNGRGRSAAGSASARVAHRESPKRPRISWDNRSSTHSL